MDPNDTLRRLRKLTAKYTDEADSLDASELVDFAELFRGLDEWLTNGGFKPSDWA